MDDPRLTPASVSPCDPTEPLYDPAPLLVQPAKEAALHRLDDAWLRARVRAWMEVVESPDLDYWIGTYTAQGGWIYGSSNADRWLPSVKRQLMAQEVCKFVNAHCAEGGAWLAGWIRGGSVFYLLYKDADGDLQIPIECEKSFAALQEFTHFDWANHCLHAIEVWKEVRRNLELSAAQQVKQAQGERTSENHFKEAPPVGIYDA